MSIEKSERWRAGTFIQRRNEAGAWSVPTLLDPTRPVSAYLTTRTVECQVLNVDEQFRTVLFKTDLDQPVRPSDKRMADRCL